MVRETRVGRSPRGRNPSIRVQIPASPCFSRRTPNSSGVAWQGFIAEDPLPPVRAAITAYGTIVLGGTVRGMGAGLACPDWPLCNGSVIPDLADPTIAIEYAHRLVAALTSLFVLLTMIVALFWLRWERRIVNALCAMTFAGLGA